MKFGITADTSKKRLPIHGIFASALFFDACLSGLTVWVGGRRGVPRLMNMGHP